MWRRFAPTRLLTLLLLTPALFTAACGGSQAPPADAAGPRANTAAKASVSTPPASTAKSPTAQSSPTTAPPATKREDISATLHGILVEDPYRWLEKATTPAVQSWVTAQNGYARRLLDALPAQKDLSQRFTELMYFDAVSPPELRGGQEFYARRYKDKEKPVLKVRPVSGEERTLIDPNELRADGSISLGNWFPSWDGKQLAYTLRENNADEATLFVRDVASGKDSALDVIPGAKYANP